MTEGGDGARIARGKAIAARLSSVNRVDNLVWSVPSETGVGRYRVSLDGERWSCTCRDFAARRCEPCKHIFAVIELTLPTDKAESAPPRRRHYTQDWAAYDRGQTQETKLLGAFLHDLLDTVAELPRLPGSPGRPPISLRDSLYCTILKVHSGLSGRRAHGAYGVASGQGLLGQVPSYMVASRLLNRSDVTPILYRLVSLSALPLAGLEDGGIVAPDSTGIQTTSFGAWREVKHGEQRVKRWLKLHALVGTKTHAVLRAVVGDEYSGDSVQLGPMLREAVAEGFNPSGIVADKGYLARENYELAGSMGIEPLIPFKANTVSNEVNRIRGVKNPASWEKAYHLFQANRAEFDQRYHRRSNVESVFSAIKRKFGENIRSKSKIAQVNEVLCKLIAYNLTVVIHEMYENGIAPQFVRTSIGGAGSG